MLKIKALNRESSSDEDAPTIRREAQEEIVLQIYNKALKLQFDGNYDEADKLLQDLIENNIPTLENEGGLPKTMSTLKYSCYFNLGNIAMKKNESQKALDHYSMASTLDKNDVTLWYKIGKLALKLNKFRQAAYAFSKGLECNDSHWPCLDELISVLYAIRDTVSCLSYIGKALVLDPNYTKGLVLRKNIYENNPATKDYYRLFNPDYVLEPNLDVEIDPEDEDYFLKQTQLLCDRINEVEKSLETKPLQCIPLPNPLEEFTWVALGKTIIGLHQYITDNNMSHFTYIDLKRCMSNDSKSTPVDDIIVENMETEDVKEPPEELEMKVEVPEEVPKEETDSSTPPERRISQNSEANLSTNETTENNINPSQNEDNEEMELDALDDQEENADVRNDKTKQQSRSSKRKRDLLSDLQIWGWHSKRKYAKKNKNEKDYTVEDAFTRIIPNYLLPEGVNEEKYNPCEDSMNTMDIYRLHVEDNPISCIPSPEYSPKSQDSLHQYFGTEQEREDVQKFWTQSWESCDAVSLVEAFVLALATRWNIMWPKELIPLYVTAYGMFREHISHPMLYGRDYVTFEMLRIDALATLLYGELTTFDNSQLRVDGESSKIHCSSVVQLQFLSAWNDKWGEEHTEFFIRVHWLRAHLYRIEAQNSLAITALQLAQEGLDVQQVKFNNGRYKLTLPNCQKYGIISTKMVKALLQNLEMIDSLSRLEELYYAQKYAEVANVLKATFSSAQNVKCGRIGRPAQLGMLLHSLWYTNIPECFIWTEECFYESVENYIRPKKDHNKWEMLVEKCLLFFFEIIKSETVCIFDTLTENKRVRLVGSLSRVCCKQVNMENSVNIPLGTVLPWIILHYILLREEQRKQARKSIRHIKKDDETLEEMPRKVLGEEDVPPSVAILFSAHDFLGAKSWCLTGQGQLLHFIVDTVLDKLDTPIFEHLRDKLDIHLEQAFFCLYQHPSKKNKISRHLADHNVNPLPLTWERAQQIYEFFCPYSLPEFDSYKSISISSELEQLLQRITSLVPTEMDPQPNVKKILDYMNGTSQDLPEPIEFAPKTRSMYYLLGDYYFKQSEVKKSTKYFQMDLCINPWRLDSWACMALGTASQLEQKLTYCEKFSSDNEFLEKAKCAKICFQKALSLANDHVTLWIEYGSFEYMVHSYCSRLLKYESETFSMERFASVEESKEKYLMSSQKSFLRALDLYNPEQSEADERWLYHYMLAKISEKSQKEPVEYLQYYLSAVSLLQENNATYPEKINYNNPPHLSIEALEVFYRINACILKYVELHEGKDIPSSIGKMFKKCLDSATFPKHGETKKVEAKSESNEKTGTEERKESSETNSEEKMSVDSEVQNSEVSKDKVSEIPPEVKSCVEDMIMQIENKEKESETSGEGEALNLVANEVDAESKPAGTSSSVIILSDSDEDKAALGQPQEKEEKPRNVQDIMDQMMKEAMNNQESQYDMESDVDSELKMQQSVEEAPSEKMETDDAPLAKEDVKKGSETDTGKSVEESSSSSSSSSDSSSSESDSDDSSSSSSSSSSDVSSGNLSESEVLHIVDRCISGLEQCIRRYPQNYKAIYRLSHLYFHYAKRKDLSKSKQLFLTEYKCKNNACISGLFADKKPSNFFNGIWRIPSSEIDRPGSLAAHMGRCVTLLLQILRATNDHKMLFDLCLDLKRQPDADKVYIRHTEREQLSEQALSLCLQTLRVQIKNAQTAQGYNKLLGDIYKSYQRSQKSLPQKESVFGGMLVEVYKKFFGDKLAENANVLDLAVKYCQQTRNVEKVKRQQTQPSLPRNPLVPNAPPVMPSPNAATHPPKRPTLGRPRGRPPGPKSLSGQAKSSRGRSPLTSTQQYWNSNMFNTKATYDYLREYREQILRQYNQTMNLAQMAQLMQNQFTPATTTSNLMNANTLLQTMQQLSASWNPTLIKQLAEQMTLANLAAPPTTQMNQLTPEQLRQIASLMGTTKASSSKSNSSPRQPGKPSKSSVTYTQASTSITSTTGSYKNLATEPKPKETPKIYQPGKDLQIIPTNPQSASKNQDLDKAALLMKDRPNISITPVGQISTSPKTTPVLPTTSAKYPSFTKPTDVTTSFLKPSITSSVSKPSTTHKQTQKQSSIKSPMSSPSSIKPHHTLPPKSPLTSIPSNPILSQSLKQSLPSPTHTITASAIHQLPPKPLTELPMPSKISPPNPNYQKTAPTAHSKSSTPTSIFPKNVPAMSHPPKPLVPPTSSSPTKTLQEKLADKQKQAMGKNLLKAFDIDTLTDKTNPADYYAGLLPRNIPSSISVMPSFPTEAASMAQMPSTISSKSFEPVNMYRAPDPLPQASIATSSSGGIDLSAKVPHNPPKQPPYNTQKRKTSSDDDVIIIE